MKAPPKPASEALLTEVTEILDPESGRWENARYVVLNDNVLSPEQIASYIRRDAKDIRGAELVSAVPPDELQKAVTYVLWEAQEEVG